MTGLLGFFRSGLFIFVSSILFGYLVLDSAISLLLQDFQRDLELGINPTTKAGNWVSSGTLIPGHDNFDELFPAILPSAP